MSGVSLKTHNNYAGFKELYKHLLGKDYKKGDTISRTDEMTDRDWDLFQNYYKQTNAVEEETDSFNQSQQTLDDREREARIQADIQMDRLNKYLPQQMRNRGLAGATDLTESALIQAQNNYQNRLGKINTDYTSFNQELLNNYKKNLRSIGEDYESKAEAINATHDAISQNAYDLMMEKLAEYSTSYEDLDLFNKYYKDNNRDLTDEHKQKIESSMDMYRNSEDLYNSHLKKNYGIEDASVGIDNNSASVYSFGSFNDTGKDGAGGTQQDPYVKSVLNKAKNGEFGNGEVVNMNYGDGKSANYMYVDGKWYQTTKPATYTYKDFQKSKVVTTGKYVYDRYNLSGKEYVEYNNQKHKIIPVTIADSKAIKNNFGDIPNNSIVTLNGKNYFLSGSNWYQVV